LIVILFFFGLIVAHPDFGSAMILVFAAGVLLIAAGARWLHILGLLLAGALSLVALLFATGRTERFISFLDPWADPYNEGYHLIQSLIAFGNGGLFGAGFGQSIQKFFYLPYPHSDFIFAVIGEELGFIGIAIFLLVFILFIWRIITIGRRSSDPFATLFATSIAALFAIQAAINIGGVTGAIPITGVTLPFISAGGTSLISGMISVGIILSISRENNENK
jgi:cell division protein FtsW